MKNFWEIREITYRSRVSFVCNITVSENWCNISIFQNIRKIITFYTNAENVCEYLKVNMNQVGHDFHWKIFESTGFVFWYPLDCFYDFSLWKFTKSKYFFIIKMFLDFLIKWFLMCPNKCFRYFFFRVEDVFFNLRVFVKFVKYFFKVCNIFLSSLIILLLSWRVIVLAVLLLLEKRGFRSSRIF